MQKRAARAGVGRNACRLGAQVMPFVYVAPEIHRSRTSFLMGVGGVQPELCLWVCTGRVRGPCGLAPPPPPRSEALSSQQAAGPRPHSSLAVGWWSPSVLDLWRRPEHAHMMANGFSERMSMRARQTGGGEKGSRDLTLTNIWGPR